MSLLWILGGLMGLILLICLLRIGVRGMVKENSFTLDLKIACFRISLLPQKEQAKQAEPATEEPSEKAAKRPLPKFTWPQIRDAIQTMAPALKKALQRTRRGIRIDPLTVSLTIGGRTDPAAAAQMYGTFQAGIWSVMPLLEQLLVIPNPQIHTDLDFDIPDTKVESSFGLSARIGTLLGVAFGIAIPALRWFLRNRKKHQLRPEPETAHT